MRRNSLENFETDVLLCGEQLRQFLHEQALIGDHDQHGKYFNNSFVASEVVEKLVAAGELPGRHGAILPMQILMDHGIIHCVQDETEKEFKDRWIVYSFGLDDNSFILSEESEMILTTLRLFHRLTACNPTIIKDRVMTNHIYPNSFTGKEVTSWIEENCKDVSDRSDSVRKCQNLLDWRLIGNVLDPLQNVFVDEDKAVYQFRLDFRRKRSLGGLMVCTRPRRSSGSVSSGVSAGRKISTGSLNDAPWVFGSPSNTTDSDMGLSDGLSSYSPTYSLQTPPVVLRSVSAEEIEDEESPYVKKRVVMRRDSVGYGFVVRGGCPSYVQVVDPDSPAAKSGLKVRQYIGSVNAVNVLRMDSRDVSRLIAGSEWLHLTVYMHFRDASLESSDSFTQ